MAEFDLKHLSLCRVNDELNVVRNTCTDIIRDGQ